jgi:hypothetical protein
LPSTVINQEAVVSPIIGTEGFVAAFAGLLPDWDPFAVLVWLDDAEAIMHTKTMSKTTAPAAPAIRKTAFLFFNMPAGKSVGTDLLSRDDGEADIAGGSIGTRSGNERASTDGGAGDGGETGITIGCLHPGQGTVLPNAFSVTFRIFLQ